MDHQQQQQPPAAATAAVAAAVGPTTTTAAIRIPKHDGLRNLVLGLPDNWTRAELSRLLLSSDQTLIFRAINKCVDINAMVQQQQQQQKQQRQQAARQAPATTTRTAIQQEYDVASILLDKVMTEKDHVRRRELWDEQVNEKFNFGCITIQTCPNAWKNYFNCMKRSATLQQQQQQQQHQNKDTGDASPARHSEALLAITASCDTEKRAMEMCVGRAVVSAVVQASSCK